MDQHIRFCATRDGVRLAYATSGDGDSLVKAPSYLTHLQHDWNSPVWSHWLRELSARYRLVRYDERGCGMSDLDVEDFSLETWVTDLETVVDAAGLRRFPLLGISAGGAVAVAYAARHPERVSRLVLYGAYAKGRFHRSDRPEDREEAELLMDLIRTGWGRDNPAFRRVFTTMFMPQGEPEQLAWFDELQRLTTPAENAVRFERAFCDIDVTDLATKVHAPTLVLHARDDAMCPYARGRELAALIPDSEFVPLEGENHILLEHEPAWRAFLDAVTTFLDPDQPAAGDARRRVRDLTPRETEVLDLVARGLSNAEIAEQLVVSPATVRNHITRVFRKLDVGDRARAMVIARDAGLGRR